MHFRLLDLRPASFPTDLTISMDPFTRLNKRLGKSHGRTLQFDDTCAAVDCDQLAGVEDLGGVAGAYHRGYALLAGNEGGVRSQVSAVRENGLGSRK